MIQINHLQGLNVSFDDIFSMKYIKVRFGRLPADSYQKLSYYGDRDFLFFSFDNDNNYYWGVYFAPSRSAAEIDNLFSSLYFERIWVPDFAHGPTDQAKTSIPATLEEIAQKLLTTGNADPSAARDDLLHTMACKAAIKGGWRSGPQELERVARAVMSGQVRYCPHGRPVAVRLTQKELEKQFKRA